MKGVEFVITYLRDPKHEPLAYFEKLTDAQERARQHASRGGGYEVRSLVDGKVGAQVISCHSKACGKVGALSESEPYEEWQEMEANSPI